MIHILDSNLINKISAGEVVERPASALKELVENALDAGASKIIVTIEKGGHTLIQVVDNGQGMVREDAILSTKRYATSKISSVLDLEKISTLGFRGEALSAISSVSMFKIQTKKKDALAGTEILIEGDDKKQINEIACKTGTTVSVRNLFFNVPARRKFLKSERSEFSQMVDLLTQFALAWPKVAWQLTHNNKEIFSYDVTNDLKERIKDVLGRDLADKFIPVSYDSDGLQISGFVAPPEISRSNKKHQFLFVNNRSVVNNIVGVAVKQAMEPMLMGGGYPVFVCFLTIFPTEVDVNVHPRKIEVKFADSQKIYRAVYHCIKNAIKQSARIFERDILPSKVNYINVSSSKNTSKNDFVKRAFPAYNKQASSQKISQADINSSLVFTEVVLGDSSNPLLKIESDEYSSVDDWIIHGQARKSFLIVETSQALLCFDQHASAEALLFKKLKEQSQNNAIVSQRLLAPITIDLSLLDAQIIQDYKSAFDVLGFEIEQFGGNSFIIQAVPIEIIKYNIKEIVLGTINDIQNEDTFQAQELERNVDIVLKYTACRSSVKFGDKLSEQEQHQLIKDIQEQGVTHCPHGRPIKWEISWRDLERKFKR